MLHKQKQALRTLKGLVRLVNTFMLQNRKHILQNRLEIKSLQNRSGGFRLQVMIIEAFTRLELVF